LVPLSSELAPSAAPSAARCEGLKLIYENKAPIVSELQRGTAAIGVLAKFSEAGIIQDG
jgi:hypothetical protein